jgi:hypothetical protein
MLIVAVSMGIGAALLGYPLWAIPLIALLGAGNAIVAIRVLASEVSIKGFPVSENWLTESCGAQFAAFRRMLIAPVRAYKGEADCVR